MTILLFWFTNSLQKKTSTMLLKSLFIIIQEILHLQASSLLVYMLHSIGFNFHFCYIMTTNNRNMFMNGVREDVEGEGDFLSLCLIMVLALVKLKGLGMVVMGLGVVMVGMDSKEVLMKIIIDRKFNENDLKIFYAKVVA